MLLDRNEVALRLFTNAMRAADNVLVNVELVLDEAFELADKFIARAAVPPPGYEMFPNGGFGVKVTTPVPTRPVALPKPRPTPASQRERKSQ